MCKYQIQNIFCDSYNIYLTWRSIAEPYSVMQNSILEPLTPKSEVLLKMLNIISLEISL